MRINHLVLITEGRSKGKVMFNETVGRLKGLMSLYNILKPSDPTFDISKQKQYDTSLKLRAFVAEPGQREAIDRGDLIEYVNSLTEA